MGLIVYDAGPAIALLDTLDVFHQSSLKRWRAIAQQSEAIYLPASAYAETLARPSSKGAAAVAAVERSLAAMGIIVVPIDGDVAKAAASLRGRYGSRLRLPDALVIATAVVRQADRLITTDSRWPTDVGVTVEVLKPA